MMLQYSVKFDNVQCITMLIGYCIKRENIVRNPKNKSRYNLEPSCKKPASQVSKSHPLCIRQ
jgi:hypothetical protein